VVVLVDSVAGQLAPEDLAKDRVSHAAELIAGARRRRRRWSRLTSMSTQWQPGQLLFVGFQGTTVPGSLARWIAAGKVGGVILFKRNFEEGEPGQTRRC